MFPIFLNSIPQHVAVHYAILLGFQEELCVRSLLQSNSSQGLYGETEFSVGQCCYFNENPRGSGDWSLKIQCNHENQLPDRLAILAIPRITWASAKAFSSEPSHAADNASIKTGFELGSGL